MPTSPEHLIVYAVVAAVLLWLALRIWKSNRHAGKCGPACNCARAEVKRNPVIADYLKRRFRK